TTLARDGRGGAQSHLRSWRDGRRSLLLYLSSIPRGLFLYPGLVAMGGGVVLGAVITHGSLQVGGARLDVHTLLYCSAAVVLGFQLVAYSVVLRLLMLSARLLPADQGFLHRVGSLKLEHGLGAGVLLALIGCAGTFYLVNLWRERSFGDLDP